MSRLPIVIFWTIALTGVGCNQPATLSHFDSDGLAFDYPSTWNAATFDMTSSFRQWVVYLSSQPLSDPCVRTSTSIDCSRSPIEGPLPPDGFVANWTLNGFPSWAFQPTAGESILVGGVGSTIEISETQPRDGCIELGGQTQVRVISPAPAAHNWREFDACINGAFAGTLEAQIRAMLASVVWG